MSEGKGGSIFDGDDNFNLLSKNNRNIIIRNCKKGRKLPRTKLLAAP